MFDTNVVVSALIFGRRLAWLRGAWSSGRIRPVVCRETVQELLRVLAYPKFRLAAAERHILLEDYLPYAEVARLPEPLPALPVACRDRNDAVFLQLTITANVDCLVSGDADLAVLRDILPVRVTSVAELFSLLEPDQPKTGERPE